THGCRREPSRPSRSQAARRRVLATDDLDEPAPFALAVELDEEDALPRPELELAVPHGHGLAGGAEEHRHAVRVAIALIHVLGADVLGAPVPVVVRVVALARHQPAEKVAEVLEEAGLHLVDAYATGRVRGVDAGDPVDDAALPHGVLHVLGDVVDGEAAGRA